MAKIGFIGLGVMGSRIARRLLKAGHEVTGYNRTYAKANHLLNDGLHWADTPRAAAETCDFVFSMVTNTAALQAVAEGSDGLLNSLNPDKIYIDMSTVSPTYSRELSEKAADKGSVMLDAPVSGSVTTLEQGQLSIMVGGDKEAFEKAKPILMDIGPKVTHVGRNGLAVTMKIATNLNLAVQMLAFSEAVLIAEKSGIKREVAVEVLLNSVIASPMVKYRGPLVLEMPEEVWFNVNMMQKDMNLALDLGQKLNIPMPATATANEILTAARGLGLEQQDFAVMFDVLANLAGVKR
jgi:3-hydroxyisobutyrate dehydrogenase-like beta-hydroxyacid dehydrogenase